MKRVLLIAVAVLAAAWPTLGAPAPPSRLALVVGISLYDEGTSMPQMPQAEASARRLARRLEAAGDYEVRLQTRRVGKQQLLDALDAAARDGRGRVGLLVALICAGDDRGLMASDGVVRARDVRDAVGASRAGSRILLVDAGSAGALPLLESGGSSSYLASAQSDEVAWPLFLPDDDGRVDFLSAASAGWSRALEREGRGFVGDLGERSCIAVEDLLVAGDMMAAAALPHREGARLLVEHLGLEVLQAIRPAVARRLQAGREVPMADVRRGFDEDEREMLDAVLHTLGTPETRQLAGGRRDRILDAVAGREGATALRAAHAELLRMGILESPAEADADGWRRLALRDGRLALMTRPRQEGRLAGVKDLAVTGDGRRCDSPFTYGRFSGTLEDMGVGVDATLFGTVFTARWEGRLDGSWLRGAWQGRYDPRSRRIVGNLVGDLGVGDDKRTLKGRFDGDVTAAGELIEGGWEAFEKDGRYHQGRWIVSK